jgi:uncharacterized protein
MSEVEPFAIGGQIIASGDRRTVDLPVSVLSDHTPVTLSVHVVHGRRPGLTFFVSAAVHGDEVIGVEIVRRLLRTPNLKNLRGTLLAVPIVNTFGFMNHSRYLPDRRDLNRSFPGSASGSLAARLANLFLSEVVLRSNFGIDIHSAAIHRTNLPQVRVSPSDPTALKLADAFGAPLVLTADLRDGSLRKVALDHDVGMLLYEAGEGLRFDEIAVRTGVSGILRVMHKLGMMSGRGIEPPMATPIRSSMSYWLRAPAGGLLRTFKSIGEEVAKGAVLGIIADPFGETELEVSAKYGGLIIGRTNLPIVNEGDGLFHIAKIREVDRPAATIDSLTSQLEADPLFDEDEII